MMKIKHKFWVSPLILVGICGLITSSCESIFEKKDPFKVISLEPLTDEIPFEELGSGKILFQRSNLSESNGYYIIDVDQKRSYGFNLNSFINWPYVSPDGSTDQNDGYHLMAVKADGSGLIQVTHEMNAHDLYVSWGR